MLQTMFHQCSEVTRRIALRRDRIHQPVQRSRLGILLTVFVAGVAFDGLEHFGKAFKRLERAIWMAGGQSVSGGKALEHHSEALAVPQSVEFQPTAGYAQALGPGRGGWRAGL